MANRLGNFICEVYLTILNALISLSKYYGIILLDSSELVSHCFTMGTGYSSLKAWNTQWWGICHIYNCNNIFGLFLWYFELVELV